MKLPFQALLSEIKVDFSVEPTWSGQVKRWSQLDAASFAVAEATFRARDFLGQHQQLFLLSSQGSSQTDSLFAHSNKISPSYFVHTLPNVRSLLFSNLAAWEGPVFCFSQGKHSLVKCLHEVMKVHFGKETLILNLNQVGQEFQCDFYKIGPKVHAEWFLEIGQDQSSDLFSMNDFDFRQGLKQNIEFRIQEDLKVRKT